MSKVTPIMENTQDRGDSREISAASKQQRKTPVGKVRILNTQDNLP
jgi:hypothetical protein